MRLLPGLASHDQWGRGQVGIGAIWVGAMSATVTMLTLVLVAVAIYRLPFPAPNLLEAQWLKAVAGGMMGAFVLAGLTFVRQGLVRPKPSFSIFSSLQPCRCSSTPSAFSERKPSLWRLDSLSACCSPVSASCSFARERETANRAASRRVDGAGKTSPRAPVVADRPDTIYCFASR